MEGRNVIVAIALSLSVILFWEAFMTVPKKKVQNNATTQSNQVKEESDFNKESINNFLINSFSDTKSFQIIKLEFVGSQIGQELREKGEWAMLVALLSILVYVGFRFEVIYGVGAIIALIHDVVITLGFFSIFQIEFNLSVLSAILAVIGYSLNDTVVVFDRIREFRLINKSWEFTKTVNGALNSTLSRTLNTSFTTLVVLLSIFLFGGESIRGFMFALIIGVLVGTYSSVFIATPVMFDTLRKSLKK